MRIACGQHGRYYVRHYPVITETGSIGIRCGIKFVLVEVGFTLRGVNNLRSAASRRIIAPKKESILSPRSLTA